MFNPLEITTKIEQFSHKNGLSTTMNNNADWNCKNQNFQNQLVFLKSVLINEKSLFVTSE